MIVLAIDFHQFGLEFRAGACKDWPEVVENLIYKDFATVTGWRQGAETPWLQEGPCHPLQQALKDLDKAYKNFFEKRADFPSFKRKGRGGSFRYPDPKQIKLDEAIERIFLPKLCWLRYRNSRGSLRRTAREDFSNRLQLTMLQAP